MIKALVIMPRAMAFTRILAPFRFATMSERVLRSMAMAGLPPKHTLALIIISARSRSSYQSVHKEFFLGEKGISPLAVPGIISVTMKSLILTIELALIVEGPERVLSKLLILNTIASLVKIFYCLSKQLDFHLALYHRGN